MGRSIDQDLAAGTVFAAVGAIALYVGRDYPRGTAENMGPGYVPWLLCWCLVATGGFVFIRALLRGRAAIEPWNLRPLTWLLAGTLAFAVLIDRIGVIGTCFVTVLIASRGDHDVRPRDSLVLGVALAVAVDLVFVHALGLPLSALPPWLAR